MQSTFKIEKKMKVARRWLLFFIIMLAFSGITALPAETELAFATRCLNRDSFLTAWLNELFLAVKHTQADYPFLFYGYDWLVFAHLILAILFIGPYKDPVRNKWVIEFGALACVLIIPYALVFGYFRGIPIWWRMIDCSFGIFGLVPLCIVYKRINEIEELSIETIIPS